MSNIDTSSWQEFRLKDLFDASNGDTDIKKSDLNGQGLPVVTSGVANYGIAGRSSVAAREFDANTITVDMFGNVMYRSEPYKMVTHARVFSLALKDEYPMSEQVGLYLVGVLSKLTGGYGFNDMCSWSKICDKSILLPVMTVGEPDWDYMAERIAEFETERIAELEAYLVATGLDDCELTDEDRRVLSLSRKSASDEDGCSAVDVGLRWKEFKVGELFDIATPKKKLNACNVTFDGSHPYVVRTSQNNGIRGYIDSDEAWLNDGNTIAFGQDTATMFYQPESYFTGDKIKVMSLKSGELDELISLYLISAMQKGFAGFSWGQSSFNVSVLNDVAISLPATLSGTPDWDYMRAYIRAQEKLVMADVAAMTQERIDATREIVGV